MIHRVLVTGSRDWEPHDLMHKELAYLGSAYGFDKLLIIHGGAEGVDLTAHKVAKDLGIHRARVDALWDTYYRSAGPKRNAIMLALAPDEALAFHPWLEGSRGTKNMVAKLEKAGIPTKLIDG